MKAPAEPDLERFRSEGAVCPASKSARDQMPALVFPEPFRRRSIEGWAIVRYDVAPWGETGNVSAVAAEPASAFGQEAVRIVQQARLAPSPQGYSGCLDLVRFVLAPTPKT